MKKLLLILFCLICANAFAQKVKTPPPPPVINTGNTISKANLTKLMLYEDTLTMLSNRFTGDSTSDDRKKANYDFIPTLVRALKVDNSFYFPFDSFTTVSKIYAPDSSFRILTWQLYFTVPVKIPAAATKMKRDTVFQRPAFRYYGVLQMKGKTLKMFPLYDAGDTLSYGTQQVLGHNNWWGQLYYNIIQKTVSGKSYYTLFGYEAADQFTRRKIIDVLTFNSKGEPKFGEKLFYFKREEDSTHYKKVDTFSRFFIEYKQNTPTVLNYDSKLEMIVFDHVAPSTEKGKGATFTYVPDGTYEGFKWTSNRWNWVETVFTYSIDELDNPPVPAPLFGTPRRQPELPTKDEGPK